MSRDISIVHGDDNFTLELTAIQLAKISLLMAFVDPDDKDLGPAHLMMKIDSALDKNGYDYSEMQLQAVDNDEDEVFFNHLKFV